MNYFLSETQKQLWQSQLRWLNEISRGCRLEIEVARPGLGIMSQKNECEFGGFSYDPKRDTLCVHTTPIREIAVNISNNLLKSVAIRNREGDVETIMFWHPARLQAPVEETWPIQPPYRRPTDT
jgi:hypothetical protein